MPKPDKPLLSLGARGTIADALTFQKRGREYIARQKPIPKDPKSPAQLAQRQRYRDAVDAWHALSPEDKEAWRGVCPGLTAYQCFMSSELKYPPPPIPIDIGSEAISRPSFTFPGLQHVDRNNPANGKGVIHTVEIWATTFFPACIVGIFYTTNGNTLKCRDSVPIGYVPPDLKSTFSGLSLAVEIGDYIGFDSGAGQVARHSSGYGGVWYVSGPYMNPGDEATYTLLDDDAISLYGIGEAAS